MKLSLHEKLRSIRAASTDEGFVPISHALCKELEAALAAFGTTSYDSDDEMFADLEAHRKAVQGQAAERDGANIAASGTLTDALIRAIHNAEDDGAAVLAVSEILRSQIAGTHGKTGNIIDKRTQPTYEELNAECNELRAKLRETVEVVGVVHHAPPGVPMVALDPKAWHEIYDALGIESDSDEVFERLVALAEKKR